MDVPKESARLDAVNLGCGRFYRSGYVNIDAQDRTAADIVADALRLPFASRTLRALRADHLLEHFDWGRTPYLLSECFRVLRPGGQIIFETPDPDASCRRFLSAQNETEREASLAWILGRPSRGYAHRWLYDRANLKRLLAEAGFEAIQFEEPRTHLYGPGLCVTAARSSSPIHEIVAELRVHVPEDSIADPDEAREIEGRFFDNVRVSVSPSSEDFPRRFRENALLSLRLTERWVRCAAAHEIWSPEESAPLLALVAALRHARIAECMERAFDHLTQRTNAVSDGYDFVFERAERMLAECMARGLEATTEACAEALGLSPEACSGTGREASAPRPPIFTRARLERLVASWRDKAVRLLAGGRLEEAESLLRRAFNAKLRYFYTAWNMAVLHTLKGDMETAAAYYRVALRFELPGPEPALRRALSLCLLADNRLGEAGAEIDRLPEGEERRELARCLHDLREGCPIAPPPPPTEAVPAGRGIWW